MTWSVYWMVKNIYFVISFLMCQFWLSFERGCPMTALSRYSARTAHFQISQGFCWEDTQCANGGLSPLGVAKNQDVMTQEMINSCCFFSYVELHYYSHWSYKTIHVINCFKMPSHHYFISLSHTFSNTNNLKKQNTSNTASNLNKVISI